MFLTLARKAAVHIQAIVRGVQSRKIFAQKRDNVIKIQCFLKTRLAERSRNVVTCQVSFVLYFVLENFDVTYPFYFYSNIGNRKATTCSK